MIWLLWGEQTGDKGRKQADQWRPLTIIQGEKGVDSEYRILKIETTSVAGLWEKVKEGSGDHLEVYGWVVISEGRVVGQRLQWEQKKDLLWNCRGEPQRPRRFHFQSNWTSGVSGSDSIQGAVNITWMQNLWSWPGKWFSSHSHTYSWWMKLLSTHFFSCLLKGLLFSVSGVKGWIGHGQRLS